MPGVSPSCMIGVACIGLSDFSPEQVAAPPSSRSIHKERHGDQVRLYIHEVLIDRYFRR